MPPADPTEPEPDDNEDDFELPPLEEETPEPDLDPEFISESAKRARAIRWEVLYRDDDFEAVSKPDGLATVSERWKPNAPTVISELWKLWQREDPDVVKPHVVHRLDRGTTGVILFARNREAQVSLREQFRRRTIQKTYFALACGIPRESTGTIEIDVDHDPRHTGKMRVVRKGKPCETTYEVLETFRDHSWIELHPRQGRTHQIRVSLASIGHPCAVDALYGSPDPILLSRYKRAYRKSRDGKERPLLGRLGLHAGMLELDHPRTGERMRIEAPLPKDLTATMKQLRRWARR